jgi:hypothetical protein
MDAGDKVDEVAKWENENRGRVGVEGAYRGVVDCNVGHQEV